MLIWENLPEGQEATGTPSGNTDAGGTMGNLSDHKDTGATSTIWSPPPPPGSHQHSPHQQTGTSSAHAYQALPASILKVVGPATTEGPCSSQRRHPTLCNWPPHGSPPLLGNISYKGLSKLRTHYTNPPHTQRQTQN